MEPIHHAIPPRDIQSLSDFDRVVGTSRPNAPGIFSTMFWKFYSNSDAYYTEIPRPLADITIDQARSSLQRIPDEEIYPEIPTDVRLTPASPTGIGFSSTDFFIKRPALAEYDDDDHAWIRDIFLAEARTVERISQAPPHENIVKYHGCILGGGRLKGIVLSRHKHTLLEHFQCGQGVDIDLLMAKLESAIQHLHSLGLAHNDLKPSNIMLNSDNMPVVIDFGSCQPFGMRLMSGGTPGWVEELSSMSKREHDVYGLKVMRTWLADPDYKTPC